MLLGCHLSIGKGFAGALAAAENLGINALQIFSHNASSWRMKEITDEAVSSFQQHLASSSVEYVVIHTMYLLNLASPDEALFERSIAALEEEIRRAGLLGIDQIVTHLGAHKGSGAGTHTCTCSSKIPLELERRWERPSLNWERSSTAFLTQATSVSASTPVTPSPLATSYAHRMASQRRWKSSIARSASTAYASST